VNTCGSTSEVKEQNATSIEFNKGLLKSLDEGTISAHDALRQKRELLEEVDMEITRQWVCKYDCAKLASVYMH